MFSDRGVDLEVTSIRDASGRELRKRIWIDGMDLAHAITDLSISYDRNTLTKMTVTFVLSSINENEEQA